MHIVFYRFYTSAEQDYNSQSCFLDEYAAPQSQASLGYTSTELFSGLEGRLKVRALPG